MTAKKKRFKRRKIYVSKKTKARTEADSAFSLYIRERDGWKCMFAGRDNMHTPCSSRMENNHIIRRGNFALRMDEQNCLCGCSAHNLYYKYREGELLLWFKRYYPDRFEHIEKHVNDFFDEGAIKYHEIKEYYGKKLEELKRQKVLNLKCPIEII